MSKICEPTALQIGEQDLNAFVDGVLDDGRRVDLFAHLASHPADAERVNGYFRQQAMLAELRDVLAADDDDQFLPDLQRRIDGAVTRQKLFVGLRRLAAAVAVLAPVAVAAWWVSDDRTDVPVLAEVVEGEIMSSPIFPFGGHFTSMEAQAIDEGTASLARLASYLDSRALTVPDLGALGLSLIGGEAIRGVELPAARLIYMDERGNRLQVYIAVVEGDGEHAVTVVPEGHLALNWRNGPLVFAVVGPAGSSRLLDVMRSVTNDITEVADAPAVTAPAEVIPAAGGTMHGAIGVQPVGLPEGDTSVEKKAPKPKMLPAEKGAEPELTPVGLEVQPKV